MHLSESALTVCDRMGQRANEIKVGLTTLRGGTRILDCGIAHRGGLEAGRLMAEMCLAGLARVTLVPGRSELGSGPSVMVQTDQPVAACLASQYAGWKIAAEEFFAMGSGPMRAAYGHEELYEHIGYRERPRGTCGALESSKIPSSEICADLAAKCGVAPDRLTLAIAPTASLAGSLQVVSRSVETALHKLHELGFDVRRVESAWGMAPLPPVAADDMASIGRTNDAILYGGEVTLWVTGDDDSLRDIGARAPSSASADFGRPFSQIFQDYEFDFYQIDPLLFSPASLTFHNLDSGHTFTFGETRPDLIAQSFLE